MEVAPGPKERTVKNDAGKVIRVPNDWELLPPGDAAATRRVKKAGPHWVMSETKGRKRFGRGVWAPADTIRSVRTALDAERADPAYTKKLEAGRARRAKAQEVYVEDFRGAVFAFLDFDLRHDGIAREMADRIAAHATPVGSGTVARTQRIPIERRAEAAAIAWMRHQTTGYDSMVIARVKGRRREVRRMLAERSRELLGGYRRGEPIDPKACPLARALQSAAR